MEGTDLETLRAMIERVAAGGWGGFAAIAMLVGIVATVALRGARGSAKKAIGKAESGGMAAPASIKAQSSANESALDRLERKGDLP